MPPLSVLIKPASSACNMNCSYCFYRDVAENRKTAFEGMLSLAAAEKIVSSALEYAQGSCSFMFQGGEPTLAGLEFFKAFVDLEKKYSKRGVRIYNSIQTNGYALEDEWARFFADNRFLVGLSLDGTAELHNFNRRAAKGGDTFNRVLRTAALLDKHGVEFNILSVVTAQSARAVEKTYNFFKKKGFGFLQFIPCLEPLGKPRGQTDYCMTAKEYGEFLVRLFDLWFADLQRGSYISIRQFDNWLCVLLGGRAESCSMNGRCSIQFVIEGDGGVYPCDFYVLDEWRLGTVGEQSFEQLATGEAARRFVEESLPLPEKCRACRYLSLCRNGCRRDRLAPQGENYYCGAYSLFFDRRLNRLVQAAELMNAVRHLKE